MPYFAYIAKQSFKDSPEGKRLFYRSGPWSRPYIVPDNETEERLFTKQLWIMRLLLGLMIFGQPYLFASVPELIDKLINMPAWFLAYLFLVISIFWLVGYVVFRADLAKLNRTESRLPLRAYFASMAGRHRTGALALGLIGCLLFVAIGLQILVAGQNAFLGWICVAFFGICAMAWGYALLLKITGGEYDASPS